MAGLLKEIVKDAHFGLAFLDQLGGRLGGAIEQALAVLNNIKD